MTVYVSSSAIRARTIPLVVDSALQLGVTAVEFTSSLPYYEGLERDLLATRRSGLRALLHNYFPPPAQGFVINLASADASIRARSIAHCTHALTLSRELGAPFYSVHAGFAVDPAPRDLGRQLVSRPMHRMDDVMDTFCRSVEELRETARGLGLQMLIENNVVSARNLVNGHNELLLGATAEDVESLFERVGTDTLGLLLDVGHLKVSAMTLGFDPVDAMRRMTPYVRALHVSDNDGLVDDNQPFTRDAWFVPSLRHLHGVPRVIETRPVDAPTLAECIRVLEEH